MKGVNYGKTPGVLREFVMGFLEQIPAGPPDYSNIDGKSAKTYEAVPPGKLFEPPVEYESRFPGGQYVMGYLQYFDIFDRCQTSRFCVELTAEGKIRPVDNEEWNRDT